MHLQRAGEGPAGAGLGHRAALEVGAEVDLLGQRIDHVAVARLDQQHVLEAVPLDQRADGRVHDAVDQVVIGAGAGAVELQALIVGEAVADQVVALQPPAGEARRQVGLELGLAVRELRQPRQDALAVPGGEFGGDRLGVGAVLEIDEGGGEGGQPLGHHRHARQRAGGIGLGGEMPLRGAVLQGAQLGQLVHGGGGQRLPAATVGEQADGGDAGQPAEDQHQQDL